MKCAQINIPSGQLTWAEGYPINVLNEGGRMCLRNLRMGGPTYNGKNVSEQFQNGQTEMGEIVLKFFIMGR
jgi:hypothetical protein